jgi:malic enzyme
MYPPMSTIRTVSQRIATDVADAAFALKLANLKQKPADMAAHVRSCMYSTTYKPYTRAVGECKL